MRRNQINSPLPTGWANTQDAMALGGVSWEQNVLLLVTKVKSQDKASLAMLPV